MAIDTPVHDFLLPRLTALVNEAMAQGIARDVAVAVLIDLVTAPCFNPAAPTRIADVVQHPDSQRSPDVIVVHGASAAEPHAIGSRDEADFMKHGRWDC